MNEVFLVSDQATKCTDERFSQRLRRTVEALSTCMHAIDCVGVRMPCMTGARILLISIRRQWCAVGSSNGTDGHEGTACFAPQCFKTFLCFRTVLNASCFCVLYRLYLCNLCTFICALPTVTVVLIVCAIG